MIYLLLLIQQLIASGTHIIAKTVAFELPSSTVLLFRALFASSVYILWFGINRSRIKKIDRQDIPVLLILGALNIPINQYLFLTSMHYTNPPNVALAYALTPAFVLIIAFLFLKEKITIIRTVGILIAIAGTITILFEKGIDFSSDSFYGDMLALIASLSWALYTIVGKNFTRKYGAIFSTGLSMIVGFTLFLPIYFISSPELVIASITANQWLQIVYLGVVTSGIGYAIWFYALKKIDASKLAVFNNMQPIFTTLLAIFILSHELTLTFIIGGILILSGVILTQRS